MCVYTFDLCMYTFGKEPLRTRAQPLRTRSPLDLLRRQKRPTIEAKEIYYRSKRDLLPLPLSPLDLLRTLPLSHAFYYRGKRDLL